VLRIRGACIRIRILIFNPFPGLRIRSREVVSFSSFTTVRNRWLYFVQCSGSAAFVYESGPWFSNPFIGLRIWSREVVSLSSLTTESLSLFLVFRIRGACIRSRILIFNPFTGLRIRSREVVSFSSLTTVRNRWLYFVQCSGSAALVYESGPWSSNPFIGLRI
jgi:hypothetical protein